MTDLFPSEEKSYEGCPNCFRMRGLKAYGKRCEHHQHYHEARNHAAMLINPRDRVPGAIGYYDSEGEWVPSQDSMLRGDAK